MLKPGLHSQDWQAYSHNPFRTCGGYVSPVDFCRAVMVAASYVTADTML